MYSEKREKKKRASADDVPAQSTIIGGGSVLIIDDWKGEELNNQRVVNILFGAILEGDLFAKEQVHNAIAAC